MTIEFFEPTVLHDKTVKAVVIDDTGKEHTYRFGLDVKRSRMIEFIHSDLPKSNKRTKRKGAK